MTSSAAAGELGCALGRERRKDAAGKGSCAEAGWGCAPHKKQGLEAICPSLC